LDVAQVCHPNSYKIDEDFFIYALLPSRVLSLKS